MNWTWFHKWGSPKWFYEMSGRWLPWLSVAALLLIAVMGGVGLWSLNRAGELVAFGQNVSTPRQRVANELIDSIGARAIGARNLLVVSRGVSDEQFAELQRHWSDGEIVELLGVVAMFAFLNRWNDTLATSLEAVPEQLAVQTLQGWSAGKHGS